MFVLSMLADEGTLFAQLLI